MAREGPARRFWSFIDRKFPNFSPVFDYLRKRYHGKRSQKLFLKGTTRLTKAIAYVLVFFTSLSAMGKAPLGARVIVLLFGIWSLHHFIMAPFSFRKSYKYYWRSHRPKGIRKDTRRSSVLMLIGLFLFPGLTYLFVVPSLGTPILAAENYTWYVWPLLFLLSFIIWRIALRVILFAYLRAFRLGSKMARVHHDRKLFKMGRLHFPDAREIKMLMLTSYIPIFTLILLLAGTLLVRGTFTIISHIEFGWEAKENLGDLLIDLLFKEGFTLSETIFPGFPVWIFPLLLFSFNVPLIALISYFRKRIGLSMRNSEEAQSPMGRKIRAVMDVIDKRGEGVHTDPDVEVLTGDDGQRKKGPTRKEKESGMYGRGNKGSGEEVKLIEGPRH